MEYIFGDESGDFHQKDGDYVVIAAFLTKEPQKTAKAFRKWYRQKFPKKIRYLTEIKYGNRGISDVLRLKTWEEIATYDIMIAYTFLNLQRIPYTYWKKGKLQTAELDTEMVSKTSRMLCRQTSEPHSFIEGI